MTQYKRPCLSTKAFSTAQEGKVADALGWATVVASGSRPCSPGDVISDKWLGECKTHTNRVKSIFFSYDVWMKLCEEARFSHRRPVLFTDDGSQSLSNTWCICKASSVEDLDCIKTPYKTFIKKNISFDSLEQLSELRSVKRIAPDSLQGSPVIFTLTWGKGESMYLMPFDSFKQIVGDQD